MPDDLPIDERLRLSLIIEKAPPHLDRRQAATFIQTELNLPCTRNQLQKLACVGGGPPFELYGNRAIYRPAVLVDWCMGKFRAPRRSTSEAL